MSHIRLYHELKVKEVTKEVTTQVMDEATTQVIDDVTTQVAERETTQVADGETTQVIDQKPVKVITEVTVRAYYPIVRSLQLCQGCGQNKDDVRSYSDVHSHKAMPFDLYFCGDCMRNSDVTEYTFTKYGYDGYAKRDVAFEGIKLKYGGEIWKTK